uniref:Uncharacterized protein n=1 Tax=Romanomermis culicivorax TaxID=13658 RepID=A0A915K1H3_ROMCU
MLCSHDFSSQLAIATSPPNSATWHATQFACAGSAANPMARNQPTFTFAITHLHMFILSSGADCHSRPLYQSNTEHN